MRTPVTGLGVAVTLGIITGGILALGAMVFSHSRRPPTGYASSATAPSRAAPETHGAPPWERIPAASSEERAGEPGAPTASAESVPSNEPRTTQAGDPQAGTGGRASRAPSERRARASRSSPLTSPSSSSARTHTPNPHVPDDLYF